MNRPADFGTGGWLVAASRRGKVLRHNFVSAADARAEADRLRAAGWAVRIWSPLSPPPC